MGKLLKTKPSKGDYFDAIGIALVKTMEERLLARFIGNGTLMSGAVKGAIGFILPSIAGSNKWSKIISTAFIVDSAEDLVNYGLNSFGFGSSSGGGSVI